MEQQRDAMGQMFLAHFRGQEAEGIIERDDRFISLGNPSNYFAAYRDWPGYERKALRLVRGRVLDIGCGAARHVLHFQEKGHDVVGIDVSPLAVQVCHERGARDVRELPVTRIDASLGPFDTITMLGNNFGLMANRRRARWMLERFRRITSDRGRIIAETLDPYQTFNPDHLAYHKRNRERGRMGGQIRMRSRFRSFVGPWIDYLFVSRDEMEDIVNGTGWRLTRTYDSSGAAYAAIIEKS